MSSHFAFVHEIVQLTGASQMTFGYQTGFFLFLLLLGNYLIYMTEKGVSFGTSAASDRVVLVTN